MQLEQLKIKRTPDTATHVDYQARLSNAANEPDWDAFVREVPGGQYIQTSLWGQVKAPQGWCATRVVVTQGEQIVAGAQVLIRHLPLVGGIGYLLGGPLFAMDDPRLTALVLDTLREFARTERIQYLVLQPPWKSEALAHQLPNWGFQPSPIRSAHTATLLIDLAPDLDSILAQMRKTHRQSIRKGLRTGITVREGTENDLPSFYRLYLATSRRQNFLPLPEAYFFRMWRVLNPHGYIKLFLTEYNHDLISAGLLIPFGDTMHGTTTGWSGDYKSLCPNEVRIWTEITWAKTHGYRYYNLEWIAPEAARAIVQGQPLPEAFKQTPAAFKLGFGGKVTLVPGSYDYASSSYIGQAFRAVVPMIATSSSMRNGLNRIFTGIRRAVRTEPAGQLG